MAYKDKEKQRARMREYRQRPEVKERKRERDREYNQRPEVKERMREYYQRNKEQILERQREYKQRKRNQESLDEFKEFLQIMEQHPECELAKAVAEIQSEHEQKELENA